MVLKNPSDYEKEKTLVYFVRHGDRIHILDTPEPHDFGLTEKGKKQAKDVAKKFSKIKDKIDILYSSPMKRAIETAEIIGEKIDKKPQVVESISEFNKIVWKNKFYHNKFWKHYLKHKKSMNIFDKILKENKGKIIVIVAHGNVIKGIIGKKLGLNNFQIGKLDYNNCHISLVRFKGTKLNYLYYFNSNDLV